MKLFLRFSTILPVFVLVLLVAAAPARAQIETAGVLLVDLRAADAEDDITTWENNGDASVGDFVVVTVDQPFFETVDGSPAVSFTGTQAYQQTAELPPIEIVGIDATRSIEAWVYNPDIAAEETIVSWGRRGGPIGSNMSFNYGTHGAFGAIGHWGGMDQPINPDIGWIDHGPAWTPGAPAAGKWHHLAYTYDGETTRVYADGALMNEEFLGAGIINTHADGKITIASQLNGDLTLNAGLRGSLSIGKLRVHSEVLTDEQILHNYQEELAEFASACEDPGFTNVPLVVDEKPRTIPTYVADIAVAGWPEPTVEVVEPAGALITGKLGSYRISYDIPDPVPDSFTVTVSAALTCPEDGLERTAEASWTVTLVDCPNDPGGFPFAVAECLIVNLDAAHPSAGTDLWVNEDGAFVGDFVRAGAGEVVVEDILDVTAVTLNVNGLGLYQSQQNAPAGLVGVDPTRSIEVWVYNPQIAPEETMVGWGHRGGPEGSNMGFNYGNHGNYGAVTHWGGGGPDMGWIDNAFTAGAPVEGEWHHLVYTYDGETTRAYADGALWNEEVLGEGIVNTHDGHPILVGDQYNNADNSSFNVGLEAHLSVARLRIHDGVLTDRQIADNFELERDTYIKDIPPSFIGVPAADTIVAGQTDYTATLRLGGVPLPDVEALAPAGATVSLQGRQVTVAVGIADPDNPQPFDVTLRATNGVAPDAEVTWSVTVEQLGEEIQVAGELFVDLDAEDLIDEIDEFDPVTVWENRAPGGVGDFIVPDTKGATNPILEIRGLHAGVSFNSLGQQTDAMESLELTPDGLIGPNPTRTIEVWAYNPEIASEETLVAWGHRGGPNGTNMSFNYGFQGQFGAVGHWGGDGPDLGWIDNDFTAGAPAADRWHHLVYTYDGTTAKVYSDGRLWNQETLGTLNTWGGHPITLACQITNAGGALEFGALVGSLLLGQVRVHDEVLELPQIVRNFQIEAPLYNEPSAPEFIGAPAADIVLFGDDTYSVDVDVQGFPTPTVTVLSPDGGAFVAGTFSYALPTRDDFDVHLRAVNSEGEAEAFWPVTVESLAPCPVPPFGGDTRCRGLTVADPAGNDVADAVDHFEGNYHAVADATDVREPTTIFYIFTAENVDTGDTVDVGPLEEVSEVDLALTAGTWTVTVEVTDRPHCDNASAFCSTEAFTVMEQVEGIPMLRADSNNDRRVNIADAQFTLNRLFLGGPPHPCEAQADSNGDGRVNIADAQFTLNRLFLGGPIPPAPHPECGRSSAAGDLSLGCADPACP